MHLKYAASKPLNFDLKVQGTAQKYTCTCIFDFHVASEAKNIEFSDTACS